MRIVIGWFYYGAEALDGVLASLSVLSIRQEDIDVLDRITLSVLLLKPKIVAY